MSEHKSSDSCCGSKSEVSDRQLNAIQNSVSSVFKVSGMDCADEISAIQNSLNVPKVGRVSANLMTSKVTVEHDPSLSKQSVINLINKSGVKVVTDGASKSFLIDNRTRVALVATSGALVGLGLLFQYFVEISEQILFVIFLIATLTGGTQIFPKALRSLKQKSLDMNVLMTLAAIGAFVIGEYSEGASVVFLFSLAEMLEAFSVARARKAISEVLSIVPQLANVAKSNGFTPTPVEQVAIDQVIIIRAGDRIPLDGVVTAGSSSVNQAPLTGESQPVEKNIGDPVFAGTINEVGHLSVRVTHVFNDTKISNVIKLVENAQSAKAPAQIFVDKFAKIYTPIVTLVALLVLIIPPLLFAQAWDVWVYRSLVFLVIACPCALVIATPVSVVSALTALAKSGVMVKGGVALEMLGKLRALAVDKTGTITEGTPKVVSEKLWKMGSELEFLQTSISLEKPSSHPLAKAVVKYCEEKVVAENDAQDYITIAGKGVEGTVAGHRYFAGNHKFAHELGVCSSEVESHLQNLEANAQSVMIVGHKPHNNCGGEVIGIFGLADSPREGASRAIQDLHDVGIKEIVMLSGDNQRTASAIARIVGIDKAAGDLLPENKVEEIKRLTETHGYVGMVGDGINDAPALAQASIGIAMGGMGSDAAIETADIALMTDDLGQLAKAIRHGRKTLGIIRFNIIFALSLKAVFIVLGLFGLTNLWFAVAADMGASLLVIANSMRLLRLKS